MSVPTTIQTSSSSRISLGSRLAVALAAVVLAVGVWVAGGSLALTDSGPEQVRLGLLPPLRQLVLYLMAAGSLAWALRPAPRHVLPVLVTSVVLLPWLPLPVPAAFLVWTGPLAGAVFAAAAAGVLIVHRRRLGVGRLPRELTAAAAAPVAAALIALAIYGLAAWRAAPAVPGGDEPHYLIITQSLLYDRNLKIESTHLRGDYRAYFAGELSPHYLRRGQDGEIYSIHSPGLPAVILPAFAAGGYRGAQVFLILLAAAAAGLIWRLAHRLTADVGAAWFAWAAVALSTPVVFHAFTIYPDGLAAILVLTGVFAVLQVSSVGSRIQGWEEPATSSRPGMRVPGLSVSACVLHGGGLALLPWLHIRFSLLAAALGLVIGLRLLQAPGGRPRLAALLALPAASATAWFWHFHAIYGTVNPAAPYGGAAGNSVAYVTSGLGGLFFDQQFGLLPHAPVFAFAAAGLVALLFSRAAGHRRLAIELLVVAVPYLVAVVTYRMWWAGWSAPARFALPVLLPLALPLAVAWSATRSRATRALAAAALGVTLFATVTLVWAERGRLAYDVRDGHSLWLEWLSPLGDLPLGLPSFHRLAEGEAFLQTAIWAALLAGAWLGLRGLERAGLRSSAAWGAITPACLAAVAMLGLAIGWARNEASGLTVEAAQLDLLRRAGAETRGTGLLLEPLRPLPIAQLSSQMTIGAAERFLGGPEPPLLVLPGGIPAGTYRLRPETIRSPAGTLTVGIGRDWIPLHTVALDGLHGGSIDLAFPIDVRAIVVRGDDRARDSLTRLAVQPMALLPRGARPAGGYAVQAVRYEAGTVFFMDEGAFVEPDAFWVRGAAGAATVIQPADDGAGARLWLRNAPVENRLTIRVGDWQEELALAPDEERVIEVPAGEPGTIRPIVRFETTAGFRPAEVERGSTDQRFLGVWVTIR